ncbi:MAG TPA: cob(I)yrinic acid a,c-diamide adenosyltransferase [Gammaproteobacteria bacterium]|nr:cob(I)yrinic acid a,c-diamide adenosyltransferase [Gammaproteobacteria bacterium]
MGHRLSRIYTRTGDRGETGLGDGSRLPKDDPRLEAIGTIDELNATVGLMLSHELPAEIRVPLTEIQHRLFDLGGELALPGSRSFPAELTTEMETLLDRLNADLPPLREFILPGGTPAAAACHLARTVCRRAERRLVSLDRTHPLNPHLLSYLNRLSDLLFVMARLLNRTAGVAEPQWHPRQPPPHP